MNQRIYISGAFNNAKDWNQAAGLYEYVGERLKEDGFDVYLPHSKTAPTVTDGITSEQVFNRDFEEIKNSQIVVALLNEPSLGVGAEIALALNLGLTVLGVCEKNVKVSRFIIGLLQTHRNGFFDVYEIPDEISSILTEALSFNRAVKSTLIGNAAAASAIERC